MALRGAIGLPAQQVRTLAVVFFAGVLCAAPACAGTSPEIRTGPQNGVPACVTPERLMGFLKTRNPHLDPRFRDIAAHYKTYGEAWRVRWDYAFFQMAVETNFLTYRTGTGRMGDVDPAQNNFAGIGTTGGGVPGDSFPDVRTGVHAQIQHLVVYSGERLALPLAPRTKLKQNEILLATQQVGHTMRFADLARRWAVDKNYGASIEWVAGSYRSKFCTGREKQDPDSSLRSASAATNGESRQMAKQQPPPHPVQIAKRVTTSPNGAVRTIWRREATRPLSAPATAPKPALVQRPDRTPLPAAAPSSEAVKLKAATRPEAFPEPSGLGAPKEKCTLRTASYGGTKTVLIRADDANGTQFTALRVLEGFEASLTEGFIRERAPGGIMIGEFTNETEAIAKVREYCPAATG